jgi:hypothetical protein
MTRVLTELVAEREEQLSDSSLDSVLDARAVGEEQSAQRQRVDIQLLLAHAARRHHAAALSQHTHSHCEGAQEGCSGRQK